MTEKIEWYREVLELEPNSKVFFPLAKLLVEEKQYADAISQLEQGLERHPEFLEARLLLIELLYKTSQTDLCNAEIEKLSKMFATYSCFWQAWAACLANNSEDEDTASIVRFLAARFVVGHLQLHDVINRGIMAILNSDQTEDAKKAQEILDNAQLKDLCLNPPLDKDKESDNGEELETVAQATEVIPVESSKTIYESAPGNDDAVLIDSVEDFEQDQESPEPVNVVQSNDNSAAQTSEAELSLVEDEENDALPAVEDVIPENLTSETEKAREILQRDAQIQPEPPEEEEIPEEEHFSLRTRSMAEVLAEQGDINGALEIYQELVGSTDDPVEIQRINQRMAALRARISQPVKQEIKEPEINIGNREKMIGILEALVRRVEARVNN